MRKISNTIVGIPLRQTDPAAIERFLVDKVRSDLGDAKDFVTVRPMIRVDSEDSDLSGNIANGYGTMELDIKGVKLHLPFIIHDKNLLPFDVIRLRDQEVPYDVGKLQKLAYAIRQKVEETTEESDDVSADIVNPKDVPSHNGFLGTIMHIRDSHRTMDSAGNRLWEGPTFGDLDDSRFMKRASVDVDVSSVFVDVSENLKGAKIYKEAMVDEYLKETEKLAYEEAVEFIKTAKEMPETLESAEVKRQFKKLDEDKLVNTKRVRSGNNIVFPLMDQGHFEYRKGRVYHNLVNMNKKSVNSGFSSVVLDNKKEYALLKTNDQFMTTMQPADSYFELPTIEARSMVEDGIYAFELSEDTLVHPFVVQSSHKQKCERNGILVSVPERKQDSDYGDDTNSIFEDALSCEYLGGKGYREVVFLIMRDDSFKGPTVLDRDAVKQMIVDTGKDNVDIKKANLMLGYLYAEEFVLLSKHHPIFVLKKRMEGSFKKPTGYLEEMTKTAAYNRANKATLKVTKDSKPRKYAIEWSYTDMVDAQDGKAQYKVQQKNVQNLSEEGARQTLQTLGYDMRRIEQFFEITKRNGRSATFNLPSVQKAQNTTPEDIAKAKMQKKFQGISNYTLNANNFMPIFEDAISDSLAGFVSSVAPGASSKLREWDNFLKTSFEVARDLEKVATDLSGATWFELSMMTNLKHQLDKLAFEIAQGSYVKVEDDTLEKVASLKDKIEEQTSLLIDFNRQQLTKQAKYLVKPQLVKDAVTQLQGLYAYAQFHDKLNEKDNLEKQAGFLNNNSAKNLEEQVTAKKNELSQLMKHFQEANIELRAAMYSPKPSQTRQTAAQVKVDQAKSQITNKEQELNSILDQKSEVDKRQFKSHATATTGAGMGLMGGLGLLHERNHHKE